MASSELRNFGASDPTSRAVPSPTVAIAFTPVDASQSPNLRATQGEAGGSYYRAMIVSFASIKRWNPTFPLCLITDSTPPPQFAEPLAQLGVKIETAPFVHRPPRGFASHFSASLYMLDALRAMARTDTLFIDPDVLCIRPLGGMVSRIGQRVGALDMKFPVNEDINGLTRAEAWRIHADLGEPQESPPAHYGGEFYYIPELFAHEILERAERAWAYTLEAHRCGELKFTTEEHILSFALRGAPVHDVHESIRRIWTAAKYRTVDGSEEGLDLWHLPAEKDRGFAALARLVQDEDAWFWSSGQPEFGRRAAKSMGIRARGLGRLSRDLAGQASIALTRANRGHS